MSMLSRFNPKTGAEDFWEVFRRPQPYRIPILLISTLIPLTVLYFFVGERQMIPPRSPDVTYITTFPEGRTDEEILASNIENQERQDALRARRAALEERKREAYRALGRATGLDVDAMEREIDEERAQEEAKRSEFRPATNSE
ncbi:hypothetical protein ACXYL9_12775 [Qipengyuania sp. CAU 1752]